MLHRLASTLARRSVGAIARPAPRAPALVRPAATPSILRGAPSSLLTTLRLFSDYDGDAPSSDGRLEGKVKWFDERKGFGFLTPDDPDAPDVFVHHTAISAPGFRGEGAPVMYDVYTEADGRPRATNVTGIDDAAPSAAEKRRGTIKWFDPAKGFGFLTPDDPDAPDVFVHHSVLHEVGIRTLEEGETLEYEVATEAEGRSPTATNVTGPGGTVPGREMYRAEESS